MLFSIAPKGRRSLNATIYDYVKYQVIIKKVLQNDYFINLASTYLSDLMKNEQSRKECVEYLIRAVNNPAMGSYLKPMFIKALIYYLQTDHCRDNLGYLLCKFVLSVPYVRELTYSSLQYVVDLNKQKYHRIIYI